VSSYSSAISACEKGQQWEQALNLLPEMRRSWLEPNVISYSSAISACEKGRKESARAPRSFREDVQTLFKKPLQTN